MIHVILRRRSETSRVARSLAILIASAMRAEGADRDGQTSPQTAPAVRSQNSRLTSMIPHRLRASVESRVQVRRRPAGRGLAAQRSRRGSRRRGRASRSRRSGRRAGVSPRASARASAGSGARRWPTAVERPDGRGDLLGRTDRGFSRYRVAIIVSNQGSKARNWPRRSLSRVVPKTRVRGRRREAGPQRLGQRLGRGDVVGAVDHEPGRLVQDLDPRRPSRPAKPRTTASRSTAIPLLGQGVERRQGDGGVVRLVRAEQGERRASPSRSARSAPRPGRESGASTGRRWSIS